MRRLFPNLQGPNRTAAKLSLVALTMVSLSFAAVPFYSWFCKVTGYGGTTANPTYSDSMTAFMTKVLDLRSYNTATLTFWFKMPTLASAEADGGGVGGH